jgi:hypothetical protein
MSPQRVHEVAIIGVVDEDPVANASDELGTVYSGGRQEG